MYLNKNKILRSLTEEDIITLVSSLGSAYPKKDSKGNLIFQTVCHNKPDRDNSWKLYYYFPDKEDSYGQFHCYTKCSENFDAIELVIRAKRTQGKIFTWYKALRYIATITGYVEDEPDEQPLIAPETQDVMKWMKKLLSIQNKRSNSIPVLSEVNENVLEIFSYIPHESWLNDHITPIAMNRFEISYYGLTNQIIIPHRDMDGRLVGIRGRFLLEKDIQKVGKYVPVQIEGKFLKHPLGCNLYGLHVVKEKVERIKKIMIVEAEKSCLQAYSYFAEDSFVVAVCGSNISQTQMKILMGLEVNEIIIAFDRDYHDADSFEATLWWNKLMKKIEPLTNFAKVTVCADQKNRLDYQDSPFDKGKEILLELLDEKIPISQDDIKQAKESR